MTSKTDLPDLTPKQLEFVKGLLSGMTNSDAYRAAYDCSGMLDSTIWANASRLRSDSKVAAWLDHAKAAQADSVVKTKDAYLREVYDMMQQCLDAKNFGAAKDCLKMIGQVQGHYVDKVEDVTETNALNRLKAELEANPKLRAIIEGMEETRH